MDSIFQTKEWEELKLKTGYQKGHWVDDILILQKNLPLGRSMLYSPMVSSKTADSIWGSVSGIKQFKSQISNIAHKEKAIFYRLELDILIQPNTKPASPAGGYQILDTSFGFVKAFEQMQPENTWTLDITPDENTLLYGMIRSCRYNIGLARKSGVNITEGLDQELIDNFYKLYSITGKRHGITFREKGYFDAFLEILGKKDYARVYNARVRNDGVDALLSAGILVFSGKKAIYMFGASSNELRNLKAPYLMVWQMILEAKKRGCTEFDFYGIAPTDDPKHPWAGITSFKKQFGGQKIDILGSYDLVFKPMEYRAFKMAEKIRRRK